MHHWHDRKEDNFDNDEDGWDSVLPNVIYCFSNAVRPEERGISEI